jgi:hypothetical protein
MTNQLIKLLNKESIQVIDFTVRLNAARLGKSEERSQ